MRVKEVSDALHQLHTLDSVQESEDQVGRPLGRPTHACDFVCASLVSIETEPLR